MRMPTAAVLFIAGALAMPRWNSAVPLQIPRRAMEDDVYREMLIPKDATIIVNTK